MKDARFVEDVMKLKYPNLRAHGIAKQYQVGLFPTLLIINRDGVIHDYHEGYSPLVYDKIAQQVEQFRGHRAHDEINPGHE